MTLREYYEKHVRADHIAECDREEYIEELIKLQTEDALERGLDPFDPHYIELDDDIEP